MANIDPTENFPNGLLDLRPYPTAREQRDAMEHIANLYGVKATKEMDRRWWLALVAETIHDFRRA